MDMLQLFLLSAREKELTSAHSFEFNRNETVSLLVVVQGALPLFLAHGCVQLGSCLEHLSDGLTGLLISYLVAERNQGLVSSFFLEGNGAAKAEHDFF